MVNEMLVSFPLEFAPFYLAHEISNQNIVNRSFMTNQTSFIFRHVNTSIYIASVVGWIDVMEVCFVVFDPTCTRSLSFVDTTISTTNIILRI